MSQTKKTFAIKGMHCASCSARVEKALAELPEVEKTVVSLASNTALVTYKASPQADTVHKTLQSIANLGFNAEELGAGGVHITLAIKGMHCASCSARVEKALAELPAVEKTVVSLASNTAKVTYRKAPTDEEIQQSIQVIATLGFSAEHLVDTAGSVQSTLGRWQTHNKDMQDELAARKKDLLPAFAFSLPLLIISMGEMLGMPLPGLFAPQKSFALFALLQLFLCLPVMFSGRRFFTQGLPALWRKSPNMDTLVALGTGAAFLFSLWVTIAHLALYGFSNPEFYMMNANNHGGILSMLFGLGVNSGVPHLYYESASMVIALVSLGKYLEIRSKMRTGEAIKSLLDLAPETAIRLHAPKSGMGSLGGFGGTSYALWQREEVALELVQQGDVILVTPGGRIPVDGKVLSGESFVDEAMLTGESMPAHKKTGDHLTAGTMNGQGALFMQTEKIGADTVLARIVQLVQEAQASKASIASLADRVSLYFVPVVIIIALFSGLFWYWQSASVTTALHFMVAVLVIACPCAMGLATPMSIMVGCGRGAQLGVLFKNGQALENTSLVDTIVFDKTGTLTYGKPSLADIKILQHPNELGLGNLLEEKTITTETELPDYSQSSAARLYLQIAASLEASSEHPLAKAICTAAENLQLTSFITNKFEAKLGQGIEASIALQQEELAVKIGTVPFILGENTERTNIISEVERLAKTGATPVLLAISNTPVAIFAIADQISAQAKKAIADLQQAGLKTVMLTGDNRLTAEFVAKELGIDTVIAEVLPTGKEQAVLELQNKGHKVAMVGDGINDAPALARADVGFALNSGIDVAVETGDVVLMSNGVGAIPTALNLGKITMRNIRQNLFWAFAYNILGIPFAAGVFFYFGGPALSPMLAGLAMALSSFSVVSNALRLRFIKV